MMPEQRFLKTGSDYKVFGGTITNVDDQGKKKLAYESRR